MAVERLRTIKSSGGDYTSLAAAEAGEDDLGNLVARDEYMVFECYSMQDSSQVLIDGWTTDATRYIKAYTTTAERHAGKWTTLKYRLTVNLDGTGGLGIYESFVRLEGLQIGSNNDLDSVFLVLYDQPGGLQISACIIKGLAATKTNSVGLFIGTAHISNYSYIFDNIFQFFNIGAYLRCDGPSGRGFLYSNTVYNCTTGCRSRGDGNTAKNNLVIGCTDAFLESVEFETAVYNAYDEGTDPGTNGVDLSSYSDAQIFVDVVNSDFHLISTSPAKDVGVNTSGESSPLNFTVDIDGQTRSGSWDIGADEYVAAGLPIPVAMHHYQQAGGL